MGELNLVVKGETTKTYTSASRTVVYATYSSFGFQNTYYWDKQTGVLMEYSQTLGGVEITMKAVETNLWQAGLYGLPIWIIGVVAGTTALATGVMAVRWKKRRQLPTKEYRETTPLKPVANMKYCPTCGTSMPLDSTYCAKCGQKQL